MKPRRSPSKAERDLAAFAEDHGKKLQQARAVVEAEKTRAWAAAEQKRLALSNAAPMMMAALFEAFGELECIKGGDLDEDLRGCECARCLTRAKVRDALAKAEGKP